MINSIPIVIIVIGVILVVLALLVWRRRKEVKLEGISNKRKKAFFAQWIIGVVVALVAAIFMFDGDILGENNTGISTVIGIVGISLIATSNVQLLPLRRK
ncbi:MAG: LPXTG cell wall anchor domain-containing protein [Dehalococcoidia bacterium]